MTEGKRVDEDWKRRAQAEKEADALKAGDRPAAPAAPAAAPGAPPPAARPPARPNPHLAGLVENIASQALLFMGAVRDPMTGQVHQDLHQAQVMIEILQMLEEKTKGNLTKEEDEMVRQVLDEVRMHYVRLSAPPPPRGPMMGNKPRA
jgi:hypothetical protein